MMNTKNKTGTKKYRKKTDIEKLFLQTSRMNMIIESKLQEIEYWREFASKTSVILDAAGSSGSGSKSSKVEKCVCKIADIEESLKNDMNELICLKEKAMNMIDRIDKPEYRALLIQRHLCGKKWAEIAASLGYSYVHTVHRLYPKALECIKSVNGIGAEG